MRFLKFLSCISALACGVLCAQAAPHPGSGRIFYVDCSARQAGDGASPQSAWNSLARINATAFSPGDTIRLRRGTECQGSLELKGSGAEAAPIRLTAYGEGARPKIVAGKSAKQALLLFNQQYWDIDSLDISGGTVNGIFISGDKGVLHHIHLTNLAVHDVFGGEMKHKESGLIAISPGSANQHFDGVLVDNVTAWNTNQWVGIVVGGGDLGYPPESDWSIHAVIRNSTVHDVQGDGIVLFRIRKGVIESSVAWNTGMQSTQTIGTPNAIWTWMCDDCTVQNNEAYLTDSPGVDGGAYDIDYGNTKNFVIDNYGHDTQGYCVAVFGAGFVTRESVVRGNLCINNGRSPRMAKYQGAIFLLTWNGGSIDGLTIENNTVYWNPYENFPALLNEAAIKAGTAVFRNNTVYSTSAWMLDSNTELSLAQNHYRYFGSGIPEWRYGAKRFSSLAEMQSGANQENGSSYRQQPLQRWPLAARNKFKGAGSGWRLKCVVPVSLNALGLLDDAALRQLTVLKSFSQQYHPQGLQTDLTLTTPDIHLFQTPAFRNAWSDFGLKNVRNLGHLRMSDNADAGTITLFAPDGKIAAQWKGFAGPTELGLALRRAMGEPDYAGMGVKANE
ncbi:MAG: right-handed parallel beta-helix repeat-containing protein [Acidobacteriaceae bacterium]